MAMTLQVYRETSRMEEVRLIQATKALLDDREECFEELDEDFVAVLQFKADIVRLHPSEVLRKTHKKSSPLTINSTVTLHSIKHIFVIVTPICFL